MQSPVYLTHTKRNGDTKMSYKQIQIRELVKSAGQESAEDMLVCMGWAASHTAAKAMIKKAQAAK